MMRRPIALVALVLSLTGTAIAASPLLRSKDVRDRSLTGADFRDWSLRRADIARPLPTPPGPPGPQGPFGPAGPTAPDTTYEVRPFPRIAYVEADGSTPRGSEFSIARAATGVYCAIVPDARWADVTSRSVTVAQRASVVVYRDGTLPEAPCPSGTTIRVAVRAVAPDQPADGPYLLLVKDGSS